MRGCEDPTDIPPSCTFERCGEASIRNVYGQCHDQPTVGRKRRNECRDISSSTSESVRNRRSCAKQAPLVLKPGHGGHLAYTIPHHQHHGVAVFETTDGTSEGRFLRVPFVFLCLELLPEEQLRSGLIVWTIEYVVWILQTRYLGGLICPTSQSRQRDIYEHRGTEQWK